MRAQVVWQASCSRTVTQACPLAVVLPPDVLPTEDGTTQMIGRSPRLRIAGHHATGHGGSLRQPDRFFAGGSKWARGGRSDGQCRQKNKETPHIYLHCCTRARQHNALTAAAKCAKPYAHCTAVGFR